MDAITAILSALNALSASLLGTLWRTSIEGTLFALLIGGICRALPRLPASARFCLWWLVSAKLVSGLILGAAALPLPSLLTLHLPAHHPAFFVARLAAQPTQFLQGLRGSAGPVSRSSHPAVPAVSVEDSASAARAKEDAFPAAVISPSLPEKAAAETPNVSQAPNPGRGAAQILSFLWCLGFFLCLKRIGAGILSARRVLKNCFPATEAMQREAAVVARLLGLRRSPRIVLLSETTSPCIAGFLHPVVLLPAPDKTPLTTQELQMALAHEMTHLRRGDLWLALIPSLAEAAFFFLPVARWAARECEICREEVCDSAAIALSGSDALANYGQLLLKVTLAAQTQKQPAPQMAMAVNTSPAYVQLRRRLNSLRKSVTCPTSSRLRRAALLLIAVCLPGMLPWHLRALPQSSASGSAAVSTETDLPRYVIVDLGTLGGKFSDAYGINEDSTVVGTANVFPLGGRGHAFSWHPSKENTFASVGEMTDLCAGSIYRHSLAYGINDAGQIAAAAFNNPQKPSAFLWTPGISQKQRRYLGTLNGFRYSRATGINNEGIVVGTALGSETDRRGAVRMRAFSWQDGKIRDLGTLGGPFSAATAISASGHVAGKSDVGFAPGSPTHAALWEPDAAQASDIGTLPGGQNSAASGVNRWGQTVGYSESSEAPRRAFLYSDGTLAELGTLPVTEPGLLAVSTASGINDAGYIVGSSSFLPANSVKISPSELTPNRAVLWAPTERSTTATPHRLIDLNHCLAPNTPWRLESARAINNRGEIVGIGQINGRRHGFLLRPLLTP